MQCDMEFKMYLRFFRMPDFALRLLAATFS